MSKKKNDILEEQRRARQEFLELKKIQHGEMEAPPKPSEIAIVPKTPKEKASNFWFQYKWYVIAIIAVVIILSVLITQCATRTKYDMEIVYFTYKPILDVQTDALAEYMGKYAEDVNGDGKVNVQIINCSYSKSSGDKQYEYTILTKLQSLIAADPNALLFITDSDSYKYFDNFANDDSVFNGEPYKLDEKFYNETCIDKYGKFPDGLQISCRRLSGTMLEKKKGVKKSYNAAIKLLEALQK